MTRRKPCCKLEDERLNKFLKRLINIVQVIHEDCLVFIIRVTSQKIVCSSFNFNTMSIQQKIMLKFMFTQATKLKINSDNKLVPTKLLIW